MSTIFGYSWEEIQAAQQGGRLGRRIDSSASLAEQDAKHLQSDLALLEQHGKEKLVEMQFFGVIDRLQRAGRLPA